MIFCIQTRTLNKWLLQFHKLFHVFVSNIFILELVMGLTASCCSRKRRKRLSSLDLQLLTRITKFSKVTSHKFARFCRMADACGPKTSICILFGIDVRGFFRSNNNLIERNPFKTGISLTYTSPTMFGWHEPHVKTCFGSCKRTSTSAPTLSSIA